MTIFDVFLQALLAVFIILLITILIRKADKLIDSRLSKNIIKYYKIVLVIILLLIFVPIMISAIYREVIPSEYLGLYIRELIISVTIVIASILALGLFDLDQLIRPSDKPPTSRKNRKDLKTPQTVNINNAGPLALKKLLGFEKDLVNQIIIYREKQAFKVVEDLINVPGFDPEILEEIREDIRVSDGQDNGDDLGENIQEKSLIIEDRIEFDEVDSFKKWKNNDDITGFYELQESVVYNKGLKPHVVNLLEQELCSMKKSSINKEKERQIRFLLSFHEPEMNELLNEFDKDRVSKVEMIEADQTISLIKLIRSGDIEGAYELEEYEELASWMYIPLEQKLEWLQEDEKRNGVSKKDIISLLSKRQKSDYYV